MQNDDGGFAVLAAGRRVVAVPQRSTSRTRWRARKAKGFDGARGTMLERAQSYLQEHRDAHPAWYYPRTSGGRCIAYALYVRKQHGRPRSRTRARELMREAGGVEKLPLEAVGWLLPVLSGDPASAAEVDGHPPARWRTA